LSPAVKRVNAAADETGRRNAVSRLLAAQIQGRGGSALLAAGTCSLRANHRGAAPQAAAADTGRGNNQYLRWLL